MIKKVIYKIVNMEADGTRRTVYEKTFAVNITLEEFTAFRAKMKARKDHSTIFNFCTAHGLPTNWAAWTPSDEFIFVGNSGDLTLFIKEDEE